MIKTVLARKITIIVSREYRLVLHMRYRRRNNKASLYSRTINFDILMDNVYHNKPRPTKLMDINLFCKTINLL